MYTFEFVLEREQQSLEEGASKEKKKKVSLDPRRK
mgnify:CR=1 FL=1